VASEPSWHLDFNTVADVVLRVTRGVLYRTGTEAVHIIVLRGAEVRCEGPLWERSDLWVGAGWVCAIRLALAKGSYFEGFRPSDQSQANLIAATPR
jgi:hypothetical protein